MTDYSDNFNRANGAPGANWTAINSGTWTIASNALTQTNVAGAYRGLRWNGGAFASNDLYVRVTARGPSNMGFGVLVRCPTSGTALADIDGYGLVFFVGDQRYRIEFVDGSDAANTGLGGTVTAATDYTIEIRAEGTTITALVNGSQVAQWTDSTYTSGGVMLLAYGGTVTFDNFEAGDIASGTSISVSDSGSGADGLTELLAALARTDSGSGADGLAQVLAQLATSDSGAGSDSQAVTVTVSVADDGQGVDDILQLILLSLADSATASDSLTGLSATIALADAGAGGETMALSASITVADVGSAVDAIELLAESLKQILDVASGGDVLGVEVTLALADSGSAVDSILQLILIALADSATASDQTGAVTVTVPIADAGQAIHLLATLATLMVSDSGAAVDVAVGFDLAVRIATIRFAMRRRTMEFALSERTMEIELRQRTMEFELS